MGTGNQPAGPCSSPGASAGSRSAGLHPPRHFLSLPRGFCSLDGTSDTPLGQYCGVPILLQSGCTKHSRFIMYSYRCSVLHWKETRKKKQPTVHSLIAFPFYYFSTVYSINKEGWDFGTDSWRSRLKKLLLYIQWLRIQVPSNVVILLSCYKYFMKMSTLSKRIWVCWVLNRAAGTRIKDSQTRP